MGSADSIINISSADSIINSSFNQEKWRCQMKSILNKELVNGVESMFDNPVCIFQVSQSVKALKPEAYTPQTVAIGPYHHFFPKLYKMQRCKLFHVEIIHQKLQLPEFQLLFDQIKTRVTDIRRYYYDNLDLDDDTMAWIMVIDGLFLLRLMYSEAEGTAYSMELVDSLGRRFSMDVILKDVVMIENQIPFFVLEHLVAMSNPQFEINEIESLPEIRSLFIRSSQFYPKISPVVLEGYGNHTLYKSSHLLDFLYKIVWSGEVKIYMCIASSGNGKVIKNEKKIWSQLWDMIKSLNVGALNVPIRIIELVLNILQTLGISISLPAESEKALTPTASQLSGVKVDLCGTSSNGVKSIKFDKERVKLSLPVLQLNANSEAIIRNLLVYETIHKPETPNFARYIKLMAAMIRSVADVKLLKERKILRHDGDDDEVVKLFDGIETSIASEGKSDLDCSIQEINEYYNNNWKIKLKRLTMKFVAPSWTIVTILATILLLLLMALQTFCSVYNCHGLFKTRLTRLSSILGFSSESSISRSS